MTFTNFESFVKFLYKSEEITLQETHAPGDRDKFATVEDLENTDPLHVAEMLISAQDSGFHVGSFFEDEYGGTITFRP